MIRLGIIDISLTEGKTDDKSLEAVMNSNLYNVFIGLNQKAKNIRNTRKQSKIMADISSYIGYFRKITFEHKEIKGFYMMDINEILDGQRSTIRYPALI